MRITPLSSGIFNLILGFFLVYLAINNVQREQSWGLFTYFLILFATFDIGTGLRMITIHFKIKRTEKEK